MEQYDLLRDRLQEIQDNSRLSLNTTESQRDSLKSPIDQILEEFQAELEQTEDQDSDSINSSAASPSVSPQKARWVILRKLGAKRGGVKVKLPPTLAELVQIGSELLQIPGVRIREYPTEAAILDISSVESDILYLTTAEEETLF